MKHTFYLPFFLLILMLSTTFSAHSLGWKWGRHITTNPDITNGESYLVCADTAGNVYVGSNIQSSYSMTGLVTHFGSCSMTDSGNYYQAFVTKTNATGTCQWITGTQHSNAWIADITTDPKGNVYVLGSYNNTSCTFGNYPLVSPFFFTGYHITAFIAKMSPAGNVLWAKNLASCLSTWEGYGGIDIDKSGNVYVTCSYIGTSVTIGTTTLNNLDAGGISPDILLAKYDSSGVPLWAKDFGSTQADMVTCTDITKDGEVYMVGYYQSAANITFGSTTLTNTSSGGAFIAKIDRNGNTLWAKSPDTFAFINSIAVDTAGSAYITGYFMSDSIKFGSHKLTNTYHGRTDAFLVKYDSTGLATWAKDIGGDSSDAGFSVAADMCGNVWMTGNMAFGWYVPNGYIINFSGNPLVVQTTSNFNEPLFMAHCDFAGNYINSFTIPGGGDDYVDIAIDNKGDFFISGDWAAGTYLFGADSIKPDTSSSEFLYFAKYQYDSIGCVHHDSRIQNSSTSAADALLYPNPASNECTLHSELTFPQGSKAEVYDLTGRLIALYNLSGNNTLISLSAFMPGMYVCRIIAGENIFTKRLLVMK